MPEQPAQPDPITDELRLIRKHVPGVRGGVVATSDGLLVTHDVHDLEPGQIAALVATMHAIASRAAASTQSGQLKEVITRGTGGYLAVYAASSTAIVGVLGSTDLNVAMLNFHARSALDRIASHSSQLATAPLPAPTAPLPAPPDPAQPPSTPLPARRPRH